MSHPAPADDLALTRQMWRLLEPIYSTIFYAPEAWQEVAALGLPTDHRWPSQPAWRAAPFGPAGAELVTATFYSFSPRLVAEHVPAVWRTAPPDRVLAARTRAMDRAFRALLGDRVDGPELAEAAALAREAAEAADLAGRPLAAVNADLPWPDEPHLVLWHAANILREHRGDGHLVALRAAGLDPVEALASFTAVGAVPVAAMSSRGWTDDEWAAAVRRLTDRGWTGADGVATERGRAGRAEVERLTDELAARPWRTLGARRAGRLAQLAMPVLQALLASGMLPATSTLGLGEGSTLNQDR